MSECGLATQDTATTPSSLSSLSTPRDSEYPSADFSSKDGQQLPSLTELDSTILGQVQLLSPDCSELAEATDHGQIQQGVDIAIVDKMRPSDNTLLRERAGGSCDYSCVCDLENKLRQTLEGMEGPLHSGAARS